MAGVARSHPNSCEHQASTPLNRSGAPHAVRALDDADGREPPTMRSLGHELPVEAMPSTTAPLI